MQNIKSNTIYDKTIKVLLIFMVLISFSSCKKECDKCEIRPPDIVKPVLFNLLNNSFKANFDFYKMNINGNI